MTDPIIISAATGAGLAVGALPEREGPDEGEIRDVVIVGSGFGGLFAAQQLDKADVEIEGLLLEVLGDFQVTVPELGTIRAAHRAVVIITSNNEKELPDAFLRRCFFHYIRFPDAETLKAIVGVHYPGLKPRLLDEALTQFLELRAVQGLKKKPSTSELLDWLKLILAEDLAPEDLKRDPATMLPKLHGALLKNEQDVALFERLAFMARRQAR